MTETTTPARISVPSIVAGMVVRVANNRAKGDNAWHPIVKVETGRNARTGKPEYTLWTPKGTLGTFPYPVRFEVAPDPDGVVGAYAAATYEAPAAALAAELTETYPASAEQIKTALDATEAKYLPAMPRPTGAREYVAPDAADQAKTAAHHAEERAYLAKQSAEELAARTCPDCSRVFKGTRMLASHRLNELTADLAAKAAQATADANAEQNPVPKAKTAKPAKAKTERAPREPRVSSAMSDALGALSITPTRALTRRELHADPMVVKAMETRGWVTVARGGTERGVDLIELTDAGFARANRPV